MGPVVYVKPPAAFQFKKGKSGNPKGRPKCAGTPKSRAHIFRKVSSELITVEGEDGTKTMTRWEAMLRQIQTMALVSADSGSGDKVGAFESRVFAVGPQLKYIFPFAGKQGFLGLKSYFEFDAKNRPEGWNTWLTFAISEAAPTASAAPPPLVHK